MCNYCKRLKELRSCDIKEFKSLLSQWKERNYKAEKLLAECCLRLGYSPVDDVLFKEVYDFLTTDWIGK